MRTTKPITRKNLRGKAPVADEPNHRRRLTIAAVTTVLLLMLCWYVWPRSQVSKVLQLRQELFSVPRDQMPPEEREQKVAELRAEREKLSPDEREQFTKETAKQIQKKLNAEGAKYFAMSPAEREKAIDERIARLESAPPRVRPGNAAINGGAPVDGTAAGGAGGGPNGPGANSTPEDRDNKRREGLLGLSPAARAGMDQMRMDMASRRAQLGLSLTPGRGFGGR